MDGSPSIEIEVEVEVGRILSLCFSNLKSKDELLAYFVVVTLFSFPVCEASNRSLVRGRRGGSEGETERRVGGGGDGGGGGGGGSDEISDMVKSHCL